MGEFRFKQVIVLRADLKMSAGKAAAQACHAAVAAAESARKEHKDWWTGWMREGQRKIVVKVESEEDLLKIELEAKALGIPTSLITDRGLTELEPGTRTSVGIGPAPSELIDKVTGRLPLY
ncbi:MAG: peptidyl-tRNA hydrolase [Candidatus Bathyarchaeota archaeon B26-2]|nr:MAG: peptidyl-tRNA hydrolase [Candidatus Bathyarchaeota archaeon B26-2]